MAPRLPDARPSKSKTGRESTAHGERERVGDNSLRYSKLSFSFPYFKIKLLQSYFLSYFVHGRVSTEVDLSAHQVLRVGSLELFYFLSHTGVENWATLLEQMEYLKQQHCSLQKCNYSDHFPGVTQTRLRMFYFGHH